MVSLMVKIILYAKFNTRLWMRDGESDGKDCIHVVTVMTCNEFEDL